MSTLSPNIPNFPVPEKNAHLNIPSAMGNAPNMMSQIPKKISKSNARSKSDVDKIHR